MKTRKARGQVRRFFRRGIACLLALTGVAMAAVNAGVPLDWLGNLAAIPTASAAQETPSPDEPVPLLQRLLLGDSALLAQWASGAGDTAPQAHPEEGEAEAELQQVSPDQIQEKTISGGGTGYVNAQGISLFNRTSKTVDLEAVAQSGSSLTFQPAEAGPQVLIVHTHATEAYAQDSQNPYAETGVARTTDTNYNIIRVGDEIARIFRVPPHMVGDLEKSSFSNTLCVIVPICAAVKLSRAWKDAGSVSVISLVLPRVSLRQNRLSAAFTAASAALCFLPAKEAQASEAAAGPSAAASPSSSCNANSLTAYLDLMYRSFSYG